MTDQIQILPSQKIDKIKWDLCIQNSNHGLIYSTADYLNAMCENWHGLVINDYEQVMALPWKKKLGIRYGYTPPFIQQLGLYGDPLISRYTEVLSCIRHFYRYADIHFNFSDDGIGKVIPLLQRTNLVLDLAQDYEGIHARFKSDLKENIRKGQNLNYTGGGITEAVYCFQMLYRKRIQQISITDFENFERLCFTLHKKNQCLVRRVTDENNTVLSIALLIKDPKRIYHIMNATTREGRSQEANHFLLDRIIHEFAGQSLVFDFEGSDLPGIQAFYKKFGAVSQPYFHYHYNGLPWPLRLLKP